MANGVAFRFGVNERLNRRNRPAGGLPTSFCGLPTSFCRLPNLFSRIAHLFGRIVGTFVKMIIIPALAEIIEYKNG
jgi:hypothetical protein